MKDWGEAFVIVAIVLGTIGGGLIAWAMVLAEIP